MAPDRVIARHAWHSREAEATEAFGEELGRRVPTGTVIALGGDLGAGKTTLVRGLARGLGIEETVASPTYVLMQAHEGGRLPLYHFDAWMEGREKALFLDGGDDWLHAAGVAVVEWAERVEAWMPLPRLQITLSHLSPTERGIELAVVEEESTGSDAEPLTGLVEGLLEALRGVQGLETNPNSGEPDAAGPVEGGR
ncbi:MAG: tRNA (adenosine(37)-N6)-threonylcarbamoyltransferase complex ATPase subunit type 1 TsaE [bacterium]|nr:tRNA (adenosine(37)-N6)-threonylcarbamoyltransferase complex ATPase subunit type 1 TsaE [bacterium]